MRDRQLLYLTYLPRSEWRRDPGAGRGSVQLANRYHVAPREWLGTFPERYLKAICGQVLPERQVADHLIEVEYPEHPDRPQLLWQLNCERCRAKLERPTKPRRG